MSPLSFRKSVFFSFLYLLVSSFIFSGSFSFQVVSSSRASSLSHQLHAQLTGASALNDTSLVDVRGTDLGLIFAHQGRHFFVFGDTFGFGSGFASNWRSNTMAYSLDSDPSDGILLRGWITDPLSHNASELISSLKVDYLEMTCIPTTAFSYDDKMFIYYMSVKHWYETGGLWDCNNASIAVSIDNGKTFTKMANISWPGDGNFVQFGWAQPGSLLSSDEYLYLLATPAGRFKACYLCRVPFTAILNQFSYEYFSGLDPSGAPQWSSSFTAAHSIFPAPVGELSVMWNAYLQKWTVFYTDNVMLSINIRLADHLWGPWSKPYKIVDASEYPSLYGSFVHPDFVENNGERVYFIMSIFSVYNTFVMSVNLSSLKNITPTSSTGFSSLSILLFTGSGFSVAVLFFSRKSQRHRQP